MGMRRGMGMRYTSSTEPMVDGEWLRRMGFTYHAIGKYFYRTTKMAVILVQQRKGEPGEEDDWYLSVADDQTDPREYDELSVLLTCEFTRSDVVDLVDLLNR